MRVLRASDYRSMPWKNGGGVTTEIAVSPDRAGLDDFDWRISMARVEGGGPFSLFVGVDRTLAIVEGEGIVLDIAGQARATIDRGSDPLSFPADAPTQASLIDGPITDLNVMTRRARMQHSVERIMISEPAEIVLGAENTLIFCLDGNVRMDGSTTVQLGPRDTFWAPKQAATLYIEPHSSSMLFVIRIHTLAGND